MLHNDLFIIVHFMMWTIVPVFLWHVMFNIPFMPSEIPSPVFVPERLLFMPVYISPAIILVSMLYSFPAQRPFRSPGVIRPASMDIRWFLMPHGIGGRNAFYPHRSFSLIISIWPGGFFFSKIRFCLFIILFCFIYLPLNCWRITSSCVDEGNAIIAANVADLRAVNRRRSYFLRGYLCKACSTK